MPTASRGKPSQVMSNIANGSPRFSDTRPLTITLVLVPTNVHSPPRTTALFMGISSRDNDSRFFLAQSRTAGTIKATTGVLFITAESRAGMPITRACAEASEVGLPSTRSTIAERAPVRSIAAATTNRAATVSMPSLAMPAKASAGERMPLASSTITPPIIAMSGERCTSRITVNTPKSTMPVKVPCQEAVGSTQANRFAASGFMRHTPWQLQGQ